MMKHDKVHNGQGTRTVAGREYRMLILTVGVYFLVPSWVGVQACRADVSFPDYLPLEPVQYGLRTYEATYGVSGQFASWIGASKVIHYGDGTSLTAVEFTNSLGPGLSTWGYNDGVTVKFVGEGEWFLSTDAMLTSFPAVWSFGSVADGAVLDQRPWYEVKEDLSEWKLNDHQMILFGIQDVTILSGTYADCVIQWTLDTRCPFANLDLASKRPDLGLALPSSLDTQGYSILGFDVFAPSMGEIAWGKIYAQDGTLQYVVELKDVSPIPAPAAILLGAVGVGLVGWLRSRRTV